MSVCPFLDTKMILLSHLFQPERGKEYRLRPTSPASATAGNVNIKFRRRWPSEPDRKPNEVPQVNEVLREKTICDESVLSVIKLSCRH
jgi:hypothetical protein